MIAPAWQRTTDALDRARRGATPRRPDAVPYWLAAGAFAFVVAATAPAWTPFTLPPIAALAWAWWRCTPMTGEHR